MSFRAEIEKIVNALRDAEELSRCGADNLRVLLAHYGPKLVDYGVMLDRLRAENERFFATFNLIDLAMDRDELRAAINADMLDYSEKRETAYEAIRKVVSK